MTTAYITTLADELHRLAAAAFALTPRAAGRGPHRMSDFPDPSPEWEAAQAELRRFGERLRDDPAGNIMVEVYDEAADRHGFNGVRGVNPAWDGIGGWSA